MVIFRGERGSVRGVRPRVIATIIVNQVKERQWTLPFMHRGRAEPYYSRLGFDWGADNGGAIELGRAFLRQLYDPASPVLADPYYRRFATEVIAKLPRPLRADRRRDHRLGP